MQKQYEIGIDVIVVRQGRLLLGLRKGGYGAGQWGLPGGHLEFGERFRDAAARELLEETGLTAENFVFENMINQPGSEEVEHYLQIALRAVNPLGEVKNLEPLECEGWQWFDIQHLPHPLLHLHRDHIDLFLQQQHFSE